MMVMVMKVTKRDDQVLQLEKEEREKQNQVLIKAQVSNRFFYTQDTIEGVSVFRIDSRTIKRENLWLSGYRVPLSEVIIVYALGHSVLTY
jgi:Flp pilus assembly protein TadB